MEDDRVDIRPSLPVNIQCSHCGSNVIWFIDGWLTCCDCGTVADTEATDLIADAKYVHTCMTYPVKRTGYKRISHFNTYLARLAFSETQKVYLRYLFLQTQAAFEKVKPPARKNFISFPFVLRKFAAMANYQTVTIKRSAWDFSPTPSLINISGLNQVKNKRKVKALEQIWIDICTELKWPVLD